MWANRWDLTLCFLKVVFIFSLFQFALSDLNVEQHRNSEHSKYLMNLKRADKVMRHLNLPVLSRAETVFSDCWINECKFYPLQSVTVKKHCVDETTKLHCEHLCNVFKKGWIPTICNGWPIALIQWGQNENDESLQLLVFFFYSWGTKWLSNKLQKESVSPPPPSWSLCSSVMAECSGFHRSATGDEPTWLLCCFTLNQYFWMLTAVSQVAGGYRDAGRQKTDRRGILIPQMCVWH